MSSASNEAHSRKEQGSFAMFSLLILAITLVGGFSLWKHHLRTEKAEAEAALVFDTCGFATKAACELDPSCIPPGGYPASCYKSEANNWCCPRGCTLENICGDTQITGSEECDGGGVCSGGGMGGQSCRTLNDVQKCVARGGVCSPQSADGDNCDATCVSEIPTCTDGLNTCDTAQGENCLTCRPDCACKGTQVCNATGQCVYRKGGGFCGDGIAQSVEQCDDSNLVNGDGCSSTCTCEACGDGYKCKSEQCDDGNVVNGDGCSSLCKREATCSDGIKNQGEQQVDCGGPCPACPCTQDADCNDGLYCTVDTCSSGTCQYTAFNADTGGVNVDPCKRDFSRICAVPSRCFCNESTNACELCKNTSNGVFATEALCKSASNTLCQDHGNPNGCYQKSAGSWCCPGRE